MSKEVKIVCIHKIVGMWMASCWNCGRSFNLIRFSRKCPYCQSKNDPCCG